MVKPKESDIHICCMFRFIQQLFGINGKKKYYNYYSFGIY